MNRSARISSATATDWVTKYSGKNIVKGYSKWFGVDLLCSVYELRILGVPIGKDREDQIRQTINLRAKEHMKRRFERDMSPVELLDDFADSGAPICVNHHDADVDIEQCEDDGWLVIAGDSEIDDPF